LDDTMLRHFKFTLALLALTVTAVCTAAFGARGLGLEADALSAEPTGTSLAQSVTIAEQHLQGRALRARLERASAGWVYDVEVAKGGRAFDVRVDANSGRVLSAAIDKLDHDNVRERY
jgi:hypothetical protein